jgi:1,2-diacylglycerol 3-beta-glucosyltransferase
VSTESAVAFAMLAALLVWPAYNVVLALVVAVPRPPRSWTIDAHDRYRLVYWIIIPALNEERVVARTVANALALDSAITPVRVLVVDDGSTDATPDVLAAIDDPRLQVLTRTRPQARQGKGEALNAAYRLVRAQAEADGSTAASIIGVIDGDGRGEPGMLRVVSAYFSDRTVGAVQCRVRIHNRSNVLALLQDLEFGCVVDGCQKLRDLLGTVGLGGNGQFVRLTTLTRFGDSPWSGCLVEDLDLGLRIHIKGQRIRYAQAATISQQGLTDVKRLVRQRTRWTQGNLQCARHLRALVLSRFVATIALPEFFQYLVTPWLVGPSSVALIALVVLALPTLGVDVAVEPWAFLLWLAAFYGPGLLWGLAHGLRYRGERLWRSLLAGLLYPAYLTLGVVAAWRALFRFTTNRNAWAKTERVLEGPLEEVEESPCTARSL